MPPAARRWASTDLVPFGDPLSLTSNSLDQWRCHPLTLTFDLAQVTAGSCLRWPPSPCTAPCWRGWCLPVRASRRDTMEASTSGSVPGPACVTPNQTWVWWCLSSSHVWVIVRETNLLLKPYKQWIKMWIMWSIKSFTVSLSLSIFLPSSLFPAIAVVLAVWEVGGGEGGWPPAHTERSAVLPSLSGQTRVLELSAGEGLRQVGSLSLSLSLSVSLSVCVCVSVCVCFAFRRRFHSKDLNNVSCPCTCNPRYVMSHMT